MKKLTLLMMLCLATIGSKAQELESILLASGDAENLTKAYIDPAMKGLIYGMNSGWYHTAKVHKKLGFDISIGLNASIIPSKDELINLSALGLSSNIGFTPGTTTPTVAGTGDGANLTVNTTVEGNAVSASFTMPSGISDDLPFGAVPTPAVQLSLGLPFKLDVMLRFVPKVGDDDVKGELLGFGLKKEITSLLGQLDKLPLHVSVLAAYTTMKVDYAIDGNVINNQSAAFKLNAFTVQAIGSLNFPIINIYGGFGYTGGSSTLKMVGTYDLEYSNAGVSVEDTVTDPLNLDFEASGFRTTIGARLSLGFFKIFGDYTLQEYNTLSAGIAFSFW